MHTDTHTGTGTHMHTQACEHMNTHAHRHAGTCTHTCTHPCAHIKPCTPLEMKTGGNLGLFVLRSDPQDEVRGGGGVCPPGPAPWGCSCCFRVPPGPHSLLSGVGGHARCPEDRGEWPRLGRANGSLRCHFLLQREGVLRGRERLSGGLYLKSARLPAAASGQWGRGCGRRPGQSPRGRSPGASSAHRGLGVPLGGHRAVIFARCLSTVGAPQGQVQLQAWLPLQTFL
uniref:Uncharacterized protein n=1 Tax=Molossus molossus TaxID=27622 RepID=A0A7J8ES36_MOLMO|nr:hypothetical protein HJG59_008788 [Molossus molossus]